MSPVLLRNSNFESIFCVCFLVLCFAGVLCVSLVWLSQPGAPIFAMTRGNQREKDRARAQKRAAKNAKGGRSGGGQKTAAANMNDAAKLAEKIARKKALKEAGKLKQKGGGTKKPQKSNVKALVNPHTGKKDAKWTEKHLGGKKNSKKKK